jgi:GNAT superfamily N-acetyltransferase
MSPEEFPRIHRLGGQFVTEVRLPGGYRPEALESVWKPLMEMNWADVFYTEDESEELTGFIGISYIPDLYSGLLVAHAQFWVIDPAHRRSSIPVRLFNAFETEAKRRKAKKFVVGHLAGIHETAMKRFFESRGYEPGETFYWKT